MMTMRKQAMILLSLEDGWSTWQVTKVWSSIPGGWWGSNLIMELRRAQFQNCAWGIRTLALQRLWPRKVFCECECELRHKRLFTCFMGRLLFQLLLCAPSFPRWEAVKLLLDYGRIRKSAMDTGDMVGRYTISDFQYVTTFEGHKPIESPYTS